MKKYFVVLLFVLTSSFVPCLKADAQEAKTVQTEQVVQVEQVIQDKSSLQNCAYYFVFSALFVAFAIWISRKSKEERNKIREIILLYIVASLVVFFIMMPGIVGLSKVMHYSEKTPWIIALGCVIIFLCLFLCLFLCREELIEGLHAHRWLTYSFYLFALYMFINFVIYQVGHYPDYDTYHQKAYAITAFFRIMILLLIITICNLCFCMKNKESFLKSVVNISYGLLLFCFFSLSQIGVNYKIAHPVSYCLGMKLPLLLFFLSIMRLWQQEKGKKIFKNIGLFSVSCLVLMIWISFKTYKRNIILGTLFSSGIFFYVFALKNKYFSKKIKMFFCFIAVVFAFYGYKQTRIVFMRQTGSNDRIIETVRVRLNQHALENFSKSKIFGIGVGNLDVDWPHNASFDLLASSGIVGLLLWYFPFLYTIGVFFKQKAYKNDINLIVFLFLGFTFAQSFFTGFYVFFTHLYFMLYFLIYRARNKRS